MKTQNDKVDELAKLVTPLFKWLKENTNPHSTIIVTDTGADIEMILTIRGNIFTRNDENSNSNTNAGGS